MGVEDRRHGRAAGMTPVEDDGLCWCGDGTEHEYVEGSCREDRAPTEYVTEVRITSPGDVPRSHAALIASTHEDAEGVQDVSVQDSTEEQGETAQSSKLFGGLGPAEAARLRWAQERTREHDAEAQAVHEARSDVRIVRVSVQVGAIIKRLSDDAKKGNVQAARELRAYLSEVVVEEDTSISSLDVRTRQAMKARLLAEVEEEQAQALAEEPSSAPLHESIESAH